MANQSRQIRSGIYHDNNGPDNILIRLPPFFSPSLLSEGRINATEIASTDRPKCCFLSVCCFRFPAAALLINAAVQQTNISGFN